MDLILMICAGLIAHASAACSRAMLQEATASYLRTQTAGLSVQAFAALANNVTYVENDVPMDINKGVLAQAVVVDFNRSLLDTTECATFTEITSATSKHPYVIHTRMLFASDQKITTIQSVVADAGDWAFNATGHLYWTQKEAWNPIPPSARDTRAVIKAAGDAYLDSWGDSKVKVPYGTPCARLEGGAYTGGSKPMANTCTMGAFPEPLKIGRRRYVIDEELGAVDIFNDFPFIDTTRPEGVPSTNLFRVEEGGIRYIHENTVCVARNCGR
ncbi:hypothetical protein HYFRA_00008185 [Hymenoscyphus fraxineus]|uniref:DUF8021 domain-containing protein n=1 Tax=Hymenoscyphus fraxineus TaxID=746836 RepID=A0A9N9L8I3_9HELO|nr:hypothetical protein HYFRA_00008185 [Hymenoscyphus fraxineus]